MAAIHWIDDDAHYEGWLAINPNGFVANLNKTPNAGYFRIHRASHKLPDRSNPESINPRTGNHYSKVTASSLADLIAWAQATIPGFKPSDVRFCKTCNPDSDAAVVEAATSDIKMYHHRASQILARGLIARPSGAMKPNSTDVLVSQYFRDPKVRAWVLQRANGDCELCGCPAPFVTDDEDPFLESHHIRFLAEGGSDTPENSAALCPNCHRTMHLAKDRDELRETLRVIVEEKERKFR